MAHFTSDYNQFLIDLAGNNNRDWFNANRKRYETDVKEPFQAFIGDVIGRLKKHDKTLDGLSTKQCIFRIYRDIRFSKDKTPYKTQMSAVIAPGGRKDMDNVGIYLELSPEWIRVYSGMYRPSTEQKDKIRYTIAGKMSEFDKLISERKFKNLFGEVRGEKNKTVPKALKQEVQAQPLLYNKQWYFFNQMEPEEITNPKLVDLIEERYLVARPLASFLSDAAK